MAHNFANRLGDHIIDGTETLRGEHVGKIFGGSGTHGVRPSEGFAHESVAVGLLEVTGVFWRRPVAPVEGCLLGVSIFHLALRPEWFGKALLLGAEATECSGGALAGRSRMVAARPLLPLAESGW